MVPGSKTQQLGVVGLITPDHVMARSMTRGMAEKIDDCREGFDSEKVQWNSG